MHCLSLPDCAAVVMSGRFLWLVAVLMLAETAAGTGVLVVPALTASTTTVAASAATAAVVGGALAGVGALAVGSALRNKKRQRGRRDVTDTEYGRVWEVIDSNDKAECVQKLMCLLKAANSEETGITGNESRLLHFMEESSIIGGENSIPQTKLAAASLQGGFGGAGACETVHGALCHHDRQQMMKLIEQLWNDLSNNKTQ